MASGKNSAPAGTLKPSKAAPSGAAFFVASATSLFAYYFVSINQEMRYFVRDQDM
jgi:hypothetical protein